MKMTSNFLKKINYVILLFVINFHYAHAEVKFYPIKPASNKSVIGTGFGLETGLVGMRYSYWLKEPAIIFNMALGIEGYSPTLRFPLVSVNHFDFYLDTATMLTPGLLGILSGDEEGVLFSKDTLLFAPGIGIQRWYKRKTDYGFYFSAGLNYWFQISGEHEGGGGVGLTPEVQIGVVY